MEVIRLPFKGSVADLRLIAGGGSHAFILESGRPSGVMGRYSFFGIDPFDVAHADAGLAGLRKVYKAALPGGRTLPRMTATPLPAGIVGFVSYEAGRPEGIAGTVHRLSRPAYQFGFYDCMVTVDHGRRQIILTSSGLPEKTAAARRRRARARIALLRERVQTIIAPTPRFGVLRRRPDPGEARVTGHLRLKSNFSKAGYSQAVKKVLEYIRRGDIYQANLSQKFSAPAVRRYDRVSALAVYGALRRLSPANFSGYYDGGNFQIVSSSPESFLRLRRGTVQTSPMKGTRPRGSSPAADLRYRRQLAESPKERAELLMITDLERNDLGRVCEFGSVRVAAMRRIEKYKQVYQAIATVEGRLRKEFDAFDVLTAAMPGGSVTGCPKIRAMQVIRELEPDSRWAYTGSMGYVSFTGDMDMNILIRTVVVTPRELSFHVGSGIVADSDPHSEYEETLVKARAMQAACREVLS